MDKRPGKHWFAAVLMVFLAASSAPHSSWAASDIPSSKGQIVYVPAYSNVFYGDKGRAFSLTTTLSIRNTEQNYPITILSVKYYDSNGKLVKQYLEEPLKLDPLSSTHFLVNESDLSGGDGPCFIIKWKSSQMVTWPIMETIMIGAGSTQGISFLATGRVIRDGVD